MRPTAPPAVGGLEISQFQQRVVPHMHGVSDSGRFPHISPSAVLNVAERVVRAPRSAVVERIPVAVGDLISAGTPVARLADPQELWIRVYVPEARLARKGFFSSCPPRRRRWG